MPDAERIAQKLRRRRLPRLDEVTWLTGSQETITNRVGGIFRTGAYNMRESGWIIVQRILKLLTGFLILKVTISVMLEYYNYFPPNFEADFLRGRQLYFSGTYQWAFYAHIASGPVSLILGLILLSEQFRQRFPKWHRSLGKMQAALVLFLLAPAGYGWLTMLKQGSLRRSGFPCSQLSLVHVF